MLGPSRAWTVAKTLASWNRALGAAGKEHEISDLRAEMARLAAELTEANAEIARLSAEAYREPAEKVLEDFEACEEEARDRVLREHLMRSFHAAHGLVGQHHDDVAGMVAHLLSQVRTCKGSPTNPGL